MGDPNVVRRLAYGILSEDSNRSALGVPASLNIEFLKPP